VTHVLLLPGERERVAAERVCTATGVDLRLPDLGGVCVRASITAPPARRLCCNTGRRFLMSRDPSDRTWFQLAECAGELLRRPRVQTLSRGCLGWREEPFSSHLIRLHWSKPPSSKSPHP
jgi:hypothetical protein